MSTMTTTTMMVRCEVWFHTSLNIHSRLHYDCGQCLGATIQTGNGERLTAYMTDRWTVMTHQSSALTNAAWCSMRSPPAGRCWPDHRPSELQQSNKVFTDRSINVDPVCSLLPISTGWAKNTPTRKSRYLSKARIFLY